MVLILYGAGTFTNYWLEHRIGMGGAHPMEDAFLMAGFGAFAVVGHCWWQSGPVTRSAGSWPWSRSSWGYSLPEIPTPPT
jgi:hypothetical protein